MSQHRYNLKKGGKDISVMAGWDRPLRQCFLTVESLPAKPEDFDNRSEEEQRAYWEGCDNSPDAGFLYNSLLNPILSPEHIGEVLTRLELPIPCGFIAAISEDRAMNVGNRVVRYEVEA